jgi:hypothetical protein
VGTRVDDEMSRTYALRAAGSVIAPSAAATMAHQAHHDGDADPRVIESVRNYFREHPLAADTLEGIARWRLLEERALQQVSATARALRWLVEHGELVERSEPGMETLFRAAREAGR